MANKELFHLLVLCKEAQLKGHRITLELNNNGISMWHYTADLAAIISNLNIYNVDNATSYNVAVEYLKGLNSNA